MNKTKIIILFGRSGAGKDTIANWIIKNIPNTVKAVFYTTRPPRYYETNEIDYFFIDDKEYKERLLQDELIISSCYNNWWYGISAKSFQEDKINICILNPKDANVLINELSEEYYDILPIYIYADKKTLLLRCLNRETNPNYSEICRRFLADEEDFKNIPFHYITYANHIYNNEDFKIMNLPEVKEFFAGADNEISDIGQMITYRRGRHLENN